MYKYPECRRCINYNDNDVCDACECGEYFEPVHDRRDLNFRNERFSDPFNLKEVFDMDYDPNE